MLSDYDNLFEKLYKNAISDFSRESSCANFPRNELHNKLLKHIPSLDLVGIDYLSNVKFDLLDFCVWFDEKTHITITYSRVCENFEDCEFSVMLSGSKIRKLFPKNRKYNECMSFQEVESMFITALSLAEKD